MKRFETDTIQDTTDLLFSKGSSRSLQPSIEDLGARPGFEPSSARFEARVDETTRMVREITQAATEQRLAKAAVLHAARFQREVEARTAAALAPVRKATWSRKPARPAAS